MLSLTNERDVSFIYHSAAQVVHAAAVCAPAASWSILFYLVFFCTTESPAALVLERAQAPQWVYSSSADDPAVAHHPPYSLAIVLEWAPTQAPRQWVHSTPVVDPVAAHHPSYPSALLLKQFLQYLLYTKIL
ncbi:hypothetical protein V6N13_024063 [Hibiscus sabdariffa]